MVKSRAGTKSEAIIEYLADNNEAMPRHVVEALKEKGINVSVGLANKIKYGKKKRKKSSPSKAHEVIAMTSEPFVSGSESIRQYIARHPKAGPKAIEAGLKAEGVTVKLGLISAVKYSKKPVKKMWPRRTPVVQVAARAISVSTLSIEQLIEVKKFANSIGGADQLRHALDMLAQLR